MAVINQEICVGCGACVKDCPGSAIRQKEGKAEVIRSCIQCGHCVAVCPVNAASIPEFDMEDVEEYREEDFSVSPEHFLRAVKYRRSIRDFKEEIPGREVIERILEAGRYTATAKNMQDCTFVVVRERLSEFKNLVWQEMPDIIRSLKETGPDYAGAFSYFYKLWQGDKERDTFFFNTPVFLVITSNNQLDGGLAAANIENMAAAEGLGALYSGYMMRVIRESPVLHEWLGIGEKAVSCCMLLGYPNVVYRRTAPRKKADVLWK